MPSSSRPSLSDIQLAIFRTGDGSVLTAGARAGGKVLGVGRAPTTNMSGPWTWDTRVHECLAARFEAAPRAREYYLGLWADHKAAGLAGDCTSSPN